MNAFYAIPALLAALAVTACDKPVDSPRVDAAPETARAMAPAPERPPSSGYTGPAGAGGTAGNSGSSGSYGSSGTMNEREPSGTMNDREKSGNSSGIPAGPTLAR